MATTARLARDCARLDALATSRGWRLVGGTPLFRLYDVGDALVAQEQLARAQIWSRVFAQQRQWLRLGLPGDEREWERLSAALLR
jgi:cobalamin biosynthetic protein CobC